MARAARPLITRALPAFFLFLCTTFSLICSARGAPRVLSYNCHAHQMLLHRFFRLLDSNWVLTRGDVGHLLGRHRSGCSLLALANSVEATLAEIFCHVFSPPDQIVHLPLASPVALPPESCGGVESRGLFHQCLSQAAAALPVSQE